MRVFAMLIGLIYPACATSGADGFAPPPPVEFAHLDRGSPSNTALAAPAGFEPAPDIVTRTYRLPPDVVYAALRAVASTQPRTYPLINYDAARQAHYVARSAFWNFPDLVAVYVSADSHVTLWSRSIYGRSDFGVNRARLTAWIAALDARLSATESPR